jgi:hypothetical protein
MKILLLVSYIWYIDCFADWMTKDFCDRPLLVNEIIMNNMVVESSERLIEVFRDGIEIKSQDKYIPGEKLEIRLKEGRRKGQQVFECSENAKFEQGGCSGTRSSKTPSILIISETSSDSIEIVAGFIKFFDDSYSLFLTLKY